MKIPYFQVDAFAIRRFSGNPAGVCVLQDWLPDTVLQNLAMEHNLSETAFIIRRSPDAWDLRWFTPEIEVDLCGHATLASAFVIFNCLGDANHSITFASRSGPLRVTRQDDLLVLDFPSRPGSPCSVPNSLVQALGREPKEVYQARDYMAVFSSEEEISALKPDMAALSELDCVGTIVTAPGKNWDFVSRFFAPGAGVPEDPVTGSAHCTLIPYWARRLSKAKLHALQLSKRGGELFCEDHGERVAIGGRAILHLRGEIDLEGTATK